MIRIAPKRMIPRNPSRLLAVLTPGRKGEIIRINIQPSTNEKTSPSSSLGIAVSTLIEPISSGKPQEFELACAFELQTVTRGPLAPAISREFKLLREVIRCDMVCLKT